MAGKKRIGIVMFQLGGPDSLEAVEPFLLNLFLDPDIIPLGPLGLLRKPIAKLISSRRSKPVMGRYAQIGRRSPIAILTERQRVRVVRALSPYIDPVAVVAMRYWHPMSDEALDALRNAGSLDEIVLLPLYPHYSYATTLSSMKEWHRVADRTGWTSSNGAPLERTVKNFYNHPLYIRGLVENIGRILRQFPDSSRIHLIFSAHGLPMSLVEKGDPYPRQIEETVRLTCEQGAEKFPGWPRTHILCYQSRVGPAKWLQPPLTATIERLAHEGVKEMLVVPISFVTEHIETLHEINIEAREEAKKNGVERFRMMPALGDSPYFIGALKDLVLHAIGMEESATSAGSEISGTVGRVHNDTAAKTSQASANSIRAKLSKSQIACLQRAESTTVMYNPPLGPGSMTAAYHPFVHRFAVFVVCWTVLLLVAGALVTSNEAALAVPDWPLSYGTLTPPMVGGIFYEHSHRLIAGGLGLLSIALAVVVWAKDERRWLRWFSVAAVLGIVAQAILGGEVVRQLLHYWLPVIHASFAQIVFAALLSIAVFTSCWWIADHPRIEDSGAPSVHVLAIVNATVIYFQVILGAGFRHREIPVWPHMAGALAVVGMVIWTASALRRRFDKSAAISKTRILLHAILGTQLLLGLGAYWSRIASVNDPQPMPLVVTLTVLHTVVGALLFGVSILLVLLCYRLVPRRRELPAASQRPVAI